MHTTKAYILYAYEMGNSVTQIAKNVGLTKQAVSYLTKRYVGERDETGRCSICHKPTLNLININGREIRVCKECEIAIKNYKQKKWSNKYPYCRYCKTTVRPHHAKGLCTHCYQIAYKLKNQVGSHSKS